LPARRARSTNIYVPTAGLERFAELFRDALAYPIITTESRPITVTTFIVASAIVAAFVWLSRRLQAALRRRLLPRLRLDPGLEFSVLRFVHYAVLTLGVLLALQTLHVDLTGVAVVAGLLGVGIGFGLQHIVSNFISGLILLIERPIAVGDRIAVGDVDGFVRAINMRATEIVTEDNISVIVPNSEFIAGRVVNWSHGDPKLRLRIPIAVSYGSDVEHASRVLLDVARRQSDVLAEPPAEVRFVRFAESSLDLELLVWIAEPRHKERVGSALHYAIRAAFLGEGIEIPFPQRELTIRSAVPVPVRPGR
jgi:small-conductance mechanosensitive channel